MITSPLNSPLFQGSPDPSAASNKFEPTGRCTRDRASRAEMLFAGHYLNLAGLLLLLTGLVSFIKSSGASSGVVESMLATTLGVVLLLAGEVFFRRGLTQYSHPLLTGGFCLLFFNACAAHFLFSLIGQGTLFALLVTIVVGSNASVFRYDSKLIGNVMLAVYFFTPIFMTFNFESFSAILVYLLAINLGTTLVALFKKWDFQLLVASLGSYALYFAHFPTESPVRSLSLLFLVYFVSLVGSVAAHFLRATPSDTNIVLSFISPSVFAVFSSVQMLRVPNMVPFTAYFTLALVHGWIALVADRRRETHSNFPVLSTTHLTLSLLFLSAGISFVTYFSNTTTYFGLVTLLWFGLSLGLLALGFQLPRHHLVLSRYSVLALSLATVQLVFVLPTMLGSGPLQVVGVFLLSSYLAMLLGRRAALSAEMTRVMQATILVDAYLMSRHLLELVPSQYGSAVLWSLSWLALILHVRFQEVLTFRRLSHLLAGLALFVACFGPTSLQVLALQAGLAGFSLVVLTLTGHQARGHTIWSALLCLRLVLHPLTWSLELGMLALALASIGLDQWARRSAVQPQLQGLSDACASLVALLALLPGPELPTLLGTTVLLMVFTSLAWWQRENWKLYNAIPLALLVARLFFLAYQPYPALCLLAVNLVAALLLRHCVPVPALFLQTLVAAAALLLPSHIFATPLASLPLLGLLGSAVLAYRWAAHSGQSASTLSAVSGLGSVLLLRISLLWETGPLTTLCWTLVASLMLHQYRERELDWNQLGQGVFDPCRLLFILAFLKSIVVDANLVIAHPWHASASSLSILAFLYCGHAYVRRCEVRNAFVLAGLLMLGFQMTYHLHNAWGHLLIFQPVLSGFWSVVAFSVITVGVMARVKVYRMFGLTTLVASALKIVLVDIHLLDSYSQTNTYLILGSLLMTTSLLYQKQRERLCGESPPPSTSPAVA